MPGAKRANGYSKSRPSDRRKREALVDISAEVAAWLLYH